MYHEIVILYVDPRKQVGSSSPIKVQCEADLKEAWEYCERNSKSVEILYANELNQKTLAKVHFRFNPKVRNT